jgi:hypothetical protein
VVGDKTLKAVMVRRKYTTGAVNALVITAVGVCYGEDMVNRIIPIY